MVLVCSWQPNDEVHGDVLPFPHSDRQWLLVLGFDPLGSKASGYIVCDVPLHPNPPEMSL